MINAFLDFYKKSFLKKDGIFGKLETTRFKH